MFRLVVEVWQKRLILHHLVQKSLTTSYRTKSLGFVWALLEPLLYMGVYYLVFGFLLANRKPDFTLHILAGVISFRFLNSSVTQAATCMRSEASLIREIAFPKAVLPVAVVSARLFDFAFGWAALTVMGLFFGIHPTAVWPLIFPVMLIHISFVLGLSFIVSYVGVFFADIQNILNVVFRLWFYMSPVLYLVSDVASKAEKTGHAWLPILYKFNVMASILEAYRAPALHGKLPQLADIAVAGGVGVLVLLFGLFFFSRMEGQIAKYL